MNKEMNYPIQYAVMEIKKNGGFAVGYKAITQGFIVSKCYVVESNITYHFDGTSSLTHKVVFPFEDISCLEVSLVNGSLNIGEKNIPSYNASNRHPQTQVVPSLFDSYEKAKIVAEEKNEECRHNLILEVVIEDSNWKEKFEILKQQFEQRLKLCNLFERLVLEVTEDMIINDGQEPAVKILKPKKK